MIQSLEERLLQNIGRKNAVGVGAYLLAATVFGDPPVVVAAPLLLLALILLEYGYRDAR